MAANSYDRAQLEALLTEIDAADERLASLKGEYMVSCKGPREDITAVFEQAKEQGIPVKAFRTIVKNRRLDKQMHGNINKLDLDQQAEYDLMAEKLGDFADLPLGKAALDRVKPQEAALDSLTQ
jgi:uncharacterized protein (UPF0335 family)